MRDYFGKWTRWYWSRYFELSSTLPSYKEAWMAVEEEHFSKFQFYKYEDYGTFRVEKSKHINRRKPKGDKRQLDLFSFTNHQQPQ